MGLASEERRKEGGWAVVFDGVVVVALERELAAGGGPAERGEVGAKGSSKIVSVWALRGFTCGNVWSTGKQRVLVHIEVHTTDNNED